MPDVAGMVLCAGLGTRLRPLTDRLPKPAVPVCGVPLVRYALALLAHAGARRAVVNVHHLPDAMASMVLMPMPPGAPYAAVEVDAAGAVRRIAGRFGPGGDGLSPWHFTGVHVLSPALLDEVPP